MSYRPICDTWILARPKVKYYGAYPNGFLERARCLLGVGRHEQVLHVCGGRVEEYPSYAKLCPNDYTMDLDAALEPDIVGNAGERIPELYELTMNGDDRDGWPGILCDPPYTREDAGQYAVNYTTSGYEMPTANGLLRNALKVVRSGGRVGMLHYILPQPPKIGVKFVACVGVIVGFNNRMRCFSVFERTA